MRVAVEGRNRRRESYGCFLELLHKKQDGNQINEYMDFNIPIFSKIFELAHKIQYVAWWQTERIQINRAYLNESKSMIVRSKSKEFTGDLFDQG